MNLIEINEIVPNSLLGLAHLSSNVVPVGVDLGQSDNRKKKLTILRVIPGSHLCVDVFVIVEKIREEKVDGENKKRSSYETRLGR